MNHENSQTQTDLSYIKAVLKQAEQGNRYPLIFVMWGIIVFFGFVVAEFSPALLQTFWVIATPLGMVVSIFLAIRKDRATGQTDKRTGTLYAKHFGVMAVFIFTAMFTSDGLSILLILGLTYSLAGIYLDRNLLFIGVLSWLVYLGVYFAVLQSNLVVGLVFAAGFFMVAFAMAKSDRVVSTNV